MAVNGTVNNEGGMIVVRASNGSPAYLHTLSPESRLFKNKHGCIDCFLRIAGSCTQPDGFSRLFEDNSINRQRARCV